jgi:putative spermidine/putrescine transport system substrate-binding protein
MRVRRGVRALCCVTAAFGIAAVGVGCGSDSAGGDGGGEKAAASTEFPASTFKPEVFGGLSGNIRIYDSDGGTLAKALDETVYGDFTEVSGVKVSHEYSDGTAVKFFAAKEQGVDVPWSMVTFAYPQEAIKAERAGYLEPLDTSVVPVDKLDKGMATKNGLWREQWGQVLLWNTDKYPLSGDHPKSVADLFDTKRFPGKRCLPKSAGGLLEQVLLADGVSADQMYPLDVERALRKLDTIKDDISWWSAGDESIQKILSGECDLGMTWSGRAYSAVMTDKAPLAISWDQAYVAYSYAAVPKGAPNAKAAQALLAMWILDLEGQKKFTEKYVYPTAIKSLPLSAYGADLRGWLPLGDNLKNTITPDAEYLADHADEVSKTFNDWLTR